VLVARRSSSNRAKATRLRADSPIGGRRLGLAFSTCHQHVCEGKIAAAVSGELQCRENARGIGRRMASISILADGLHRPTPAVGLRRRTPSRSRPLPPPVASASLFSHTATSSSRTRCLPRLPPSQPRPPAPAALRVRWCATASCPNTAYLGPRGPPPGARVGRSRSRVRGARQLAEFKWVCVERPYSSRRGLTEIGSGTGTGSGRGSGPSAELTKWYCA
jgi:hypothetical protein